jgi:hypothetical protein
VAASRPAHVITRAEMARRLGVSRSAVTRACRPGARLAPACSGSGINVLHGESRRWLVQRAATRVEPLPLDGGISVDDGEDNADTERPSSDELERQLGPRQFTDLEELAEPLTTLTEAYGDAPALAAWVRCRKMLEEARKARMLRARIEGRLIARTTVVRMIDHVDVAFRLLLADAPRTIAARLLVSDVPGATATIREVMGRMLEEAQTHMGAALEADDPMAPLMEAAE